MPNYFEKYDNSKPAPKDPQVQSAAASASDNYFAQKYGAAGQTVPAGAASSSDEGSFMAGVENFNRVFGSIAEGTIDLVAKAVGSNTLEQRVATLHNTLQASADKASELHPVASNIGKGLGLAGLAALPLSAMKTGAGLASSMVTGAEAGLGYGFLNYTPTVEERFKNAATGGLLGAAAPVVGEGAKNLPAVTKGLLSGSEGLNKVGGVVGKALIIKSLLGL